jgi:hypothetical protein
LLNPATQQCCFDDALKRLSKAKGLRGNGDENMTQHILVKPAMAQPRFSLNMPGVDELFPGFALGDFAVLYGSPSVTSLTSLLCVRAQLPPQLGGLGSNVVFVDGGNTFRLYNIARLARLHQLDPRQVLERIFISRGFTAYQLTSLIMEKLEETIQKYKAELVVISDLAGFFLDNDVPQEEAEGIYNQIVTYLSNFARKHQIVLVATYLPYQGGKRNRQLQEMTCAKAGTVLRFSKTPSTREVALEKHSSFVLGTVELPSQNTTLTAFMNPAWGRATV